MCSHIWRKPGACLHSRAPCLHPLVHVLPLSSLPAWRRPLTWRRAQTACLYTTSWRAWPPWCAQRLTCRSMDADNALASLRMKPASGAQAQEACTHAGMRIALESPGRPRQQQALGTVLVCQPKPKACHSCARRCGCSKRLRWHTRRLPPRSSRRSCRRRPSGRRSRHRTRRWAKCKSSTACGAGARRRIGCLLARRRHRPAALQRHGAFGLLHARAARPRRARRRTLEACDQTDRCGRGVAPRTAGG